jgi:hypothetical protein
MPSERPSTLYELMFDSTTKTKQRLTDAVDLLIDFATLGEYGLEPAGRPRQGCADPSPATHRAATLSTPRAPGRTAVRRDATCNLLQEAGFRRPGREFAR